MLAQPGSNAAAQRQQPTARAADHGTDHRTARRKAVPFLPFFVPALLLILFVLLPASPAQAATLTVCPTGGQYFAIQDAVNVAEAGDVIQICAGTYAENVDLGLMGSNGGFQGSITLQGVGDVLIAPATGKAISLFLSPDYFTGDVVLDNINATSPDASAIDVSFILGSFTMNGGSASNAGSVSNTGGEVGLVVARITGQVTISGATFLNNAGKGLQIFTEFDENGCATPTTVINIVGTRAAGNGAQGIILYPFYGDVIINNSESFNNVSGGFTVIYLDACEGSTVFVNGSRAADNGKSGFSINSPHLSMADSLAQGNGDTGIQYAFSQPSLRAAAAAQRAAAAAGPPSTVVLRTSANGNGGNGIDVRDSDRVTISQVSAITNSATGIFVALPSDAPTDQQVAIDSSYVFANQFGIQFAESVILPSEALAAAAITTTVSSSIVCQNQDAGLKVINGPERDYNAAGNYWGSYTGPFHAVKNPSGMGDNVIDATNGGSTGNVLIAPWVERGDITIEPADGLVGAQQMVSVTFPAGGGAGLARNPGDPNTRLFFRLATNIGELASAYGTGPVVPVALDATGVITALLTPASPGSAIIVVSGPCGLQGEQLFTVANPSIQISKNPPEQTVARGGAATFQVAITNTGDIALTNVTVSDPLAPACERSLSVLDPGESTAFTCRQDGVSSSYTNLITVAGTPMADVPVQAPVTATATAQVFVVNPAVTISKNPPEQTVVSGGAATFRVVITNTGDIALTNVTVSDPAVPACQGILNDLGPGISVGFDCEQMGVTASYTNQITVTGTPLTNPPDALPPVTATATARVVVVNPAISISKTPEQQTVVSGGGATFQVAVNNTGGITLTDVVVADPLALACGRSLADLPPNGSASFACTQADVTASYTNQITVTANPLTDPPLQAPVTATATAQVVVVNPAISISKNPPLQAVVNGGDATFQVAITNTGDISLTNVTVSDPLVPACGRGLSDLGPGQGTSFTCAQEDVPVSYTNRITVTADLLPPPAASKGAALALIAPAAVATATAQVVVASPGLSAVKSVGLDPDACAPAGPLTAAINSSLYYCITVMNTGDITLTDHVLTDLPLGIGATPIAAPLAPGASVAITRSLLPALGPIVMTGTITNVVSITSTAGITDVGGVFVPVTGVQVHSAADVQVDPQPTGLDPEPEPVNMTQWLYLPALRR